MLVENHDAVLPQHGGGDAAAGYGAARETAIIYTAAAARGTGLGQNRYCDRMLETNGQGLAGAVGGYVFYRLGRAALADRLAESGGKSA